MTFLQMSDELAPRPKKLLGCDRFFQEHIIHKNYMIIPVLYMRIGEASSLITTLLAHCFLNNEHLSFKSHRCNPC